MYSLGILCLTLNQRGWKSHSLTLRHRRAAALLATRIAEPEKKRDTDRAEENFFADLKEEVGQISETLPPFEYSMPESSSDEGMFPPFF